MKGDSLTVRCLLSVSSEQGTGVTGGSRAGGVEVWGCRSPILFSFILFLTLYFAYPQPGQLICA